MSDAIRLLKSDVSVQEAPDEECAKCTVGPANFLVMIDYRTLGTVAPFDGSRFCEPCAEKIAQRIQAALPAR
jgi:hypothetical protein